MKIKTLAIVAALTLSVSLVSGCGEFEPDAKDVQAAKGKQLAESITFTENAEQENIHKRLKLTSNPGLQGYVMLINETGQPVMYASVDGKITSGSKRLTSKFSYYNGYKKDEPSDEGTWGSSSPYIYFWTTSGQYVQWNGKYLFSDKPFRLTTKPLVIDINTK